MKKIAVITTFDVNRDPRPKRVSRCLSRNFAVTIIGPGECNDSSYGHIKINLHGHDTLSFKVKKSVFLVLGNYQSYLNHSYQEYYSILSANNFDLIVCHDLEILPIAIAASAQSRIIFDAREYYPLHFEDSFNWRMLHKKKNHNLCKKYLAKADEMLCVSDGILKKYFAEYQRTGTLYESWPDFADIKPSPVADSKLKMIHHGGANKNRRIELMIEMMDFLGSGFHLDLMLVGGEKKYLKYLQEQAGRRKNVRIIKPVAQSEIVNFCSNYDVGLFICPPTTFNLQYALPNKLFEFIQSRLMVAVTPSVEMKRVVEKYNVGIVAEDYTPASMAKALNKLTKEQIEEYKNNSNIAASVLNAENNCENLQKIVTSLLQ